MASKFKIGDYVWGKMKGFPAWPGRIKEPTANIKVPQDKKKKFVFFFHSENYAWLLEDQIFDYNENKERFQAVNRVPKGFKEAVEALEESMKNDPPPEKNLPSIDDEVAMMSDDTKPKKKSTTEKSKKSDSTTPKVPKKRTANTPHRDSDQPKKAKKTKEDKPTLNHVSHKNDDPFSPESNSVKKLDYRQFLSEFGEKPRKESRAAAGDSQDLTFSSDELLPKDNIIATPAKIGFLGLGIMGSGMVTNLLRSGHEVTVWNRTPSKCRDFIKEGALRGNSPKEVVEQCDIIFSCVSDPAALKELVFDNCGVLDGIESEKGYVDLSTVDTETISNIAEAITAHGGRFLEAEVMGSRDCARDGNLVILAAGDRGLYNDCYSCFSAMGRKSYFLGETGAATKMKAVMNLLSGTIIAGLAESLALSEKVGLDTDEVMQVLEMSPANCPLVKKLANDMVKSNYQEPHCKLQVMQKNLRLVVNMSDNVDQPLHVGSAVNEFFKKAKAKGYGEHDQAAIYRAADL